MRILSRRAHRGPNRYVFVPVVYLVVETTDETACLALARCALALQRELGHDVRFSRVSPGRHRGRREVLFQCRIPEVGLLAAESAEAIVRGDRSPDSEAREVTRFRTRACSHCYGPSTESIIRAAEARGIPWASLGSGSLVRLGTGCRQRRLRATLTGRTSALATDIAGDKSLANQLLREAGLPVPEQRVTAHEDEAVQSAREIGGPVVVKPLDANHGRGVSIRPEGDAAVREAFREAAAVRAQVLVESWVSGDDHRLLVVDGRLVAAARRTPAHVVGDGMRTLAELVDAVNRDPRRGDGHQRVLTRVVLDDEAQRLMAQQGVAASTVIAEGLRIDLRHTANLSKGATAEDVTDQVHPDNRRLAERAARVIGLDVAGIDFLTPDITRSFHEVGGAICEVNAAPGLRMHVQPCAGSPRDVGHSVVDMLFPEGRPATVPTTAITGTNGKTTTARMVAHVHGLRGLCVGLATTDGVYIGGELAVPGDMTGPVATRKVIDDPTVECAVIELARGGLLREGLAIDACDVGAVTNIDNDHIGLDGIETLDHMAQLKGIVARIARGTAVLNADDERLVELAQRCTRAERIAWVTMRADNPLVRLHIRYGGIAGVFEQAPKGGTLTLYDGGLARPVAPAADLPITMGGLARHNVQNALFAAVIAYAGGASVPEIQRGLRSFTPSWETTPGRLNLYRGHSFDVLMDYGHNPSGFRAIGELALRLRARRRICVVGYPGNRRDADIGEAARALVPYFDLFVCRGEDDPRGRPPEQIPRMLERAFRDAGVSNDRLVVVLDEAGGIDRALALAEPGDLVVVFAADLERTWKQIVGFEGQVPAVRETRASFTS